MSGERTFPGGKVALIEQMRAWREIARHAATLPPDTPEWQQLADEARHRRTLLDQRMLDASFYRLEVRRRHPPTQSR